MINRIFNQKLKQLIILTFFIFILLPNLFFNTEGSYIMDQDYSYKININLYDLHSNQLRKIVSDKEFKQYPDIYKDKVIWCNTERNGGEIYQYNLSTEMKEKIITNSYYTFYMNHNSDFLVFEDGRENPKSWKEYPEITVIAFNSKEEVIITNDYFEQRLPSIYKNNVVWTDYRNDSNGISEYYSNIDNGDIYLFNLNNKKEKMITNDLNNQIYPSIYKNFIVWLDYRYNNSSEIILYNIFNNTIERITNNSIEEHRPLILNNKILWSYNIYKENKRNVSTILVIYDIETKNKIDINPGYYIHPEELDFDDNWIVWSDFNGDIDPSPSNLYIYNISTKKIQKITTNDDLKGVHPRICNSKIVFTNTILFKKEKKEEGKGFITSFETSIFLIIILFIVTKMRKKK